MISDIQYNSRRMAGTGMLSPGCLSSSSRSSSSSRTLTVVCVESTCAMMLLLLLLLPAVTYTVTAADTCSEIVHPSDLAAALNSSLLSDQLVHNHSHPDITRHVVMATATADIIRRMMVSHVIIFYHDDYSHTALSTLTQQLGQAFVTFNLVDLGLFSMEEAFSDMDTLKTENNTFVLLADQTLTDAVLDKAKSSHLIGPLYNWVLMSFDYDAWDIVPKALVNLGDRLVVVQLNSIDWTQFETGICGLASLVPPARLERYGLGRFSTVGWWSSHRGWNLTSNVFPPFRGFYGKLFTVATLPVEYITHKKTINGTDYYFGIFFEVLNALAQSLKFTYRVVEPEDQIFGAPVANGSWSGIIGMIQRKEVHFGVGPFTISAERKAAVDFMHPVHREALSMLMRKPKDDSLSSAFVLVQPFKMEVWICFAFSVMFAAIAMWIIARVDPAHPHWRATNFMLNRGDIWLLRKSFWYSLGTALNQGGIVPNTTFATFTIVISVWLMNIILLATYTGNLIAFLTVTKLSIPINSVDELVNQNVYKVGVMGNTAHQSIFETATQGFYKKVWNKINDDPANLVVNIEQGYHKVKTENYVFINEKTMFDILTSIDCDIVVAKETFLPRGLGFPIQKGSPYTRIFDLATLRILEGGLVDKWRETYLTRNSQCSLASTQTEAKGLGLVGLQGAFILLAMGMVIGAIALLVEVIVYRKLYNKIWPAKSSNGTVLTVVEEFK